MNMKKITFQEAQAKESELKEEIIDRMKCNVDEFEVVQYKSSQIGVHWCATARQKKSQTSIPEGWIVGSVDWKENSLSMYASLECFLVFN